MLTGCSIQSKVDGRTAEEWKNEYETLKVDTEESEMIKNYRNIEFGIEIDYPGNWITGEEFISDDGETKAVTFSPKKEEGEEQTQFISIAIDQLEGLTTPLLKQLILKFSKESSRDSLIEDVQFMGGNGFRTSHVPDKKTMIRLDYYIIKNDKKYFLRYYLGRDNKSKELNNYQLKMFIDSFKEI